MTEAHGPDITSQLQGEVQELKTDFAGIFSSDEIEQCVRDSLDALTAAQPGVTAFLPALVHRFARERLRARAYAQGKMARKHAGVLFVCVQNAGRSQMAAVLTEHLSNGQVMVRSAGSAPAGEVDQRVAQVMEELGLDISDAFPKPLTDEFVHAADVVVTMGCGDSCPVFPGKRYVDWDVDDPSGHQIEAVRLIRDDISRRVSKLLSNLGVAPRVS